jgi:hypothetical protein
MAVEICKTLPSLSRSHNLASEADVKTGIGDGGGSAGTGRVIKILVFSNLSKADETRWAWGEEPRELVAQYVVSRTFPCKY